jgi:hypothetical protein
MIDALILAGVGLLISGSGIAVSSGRTDLLAQYPDKSGSRETAVRTGGVLTIYGLLTLVTALLLTQIDLSTTLWIGWTLLTVLVGFGVATLAATSN